MSSRAMPPLPTTMTLLAPGSLAHSAPMLSVSLNVSTFGLSVANRLGRAPAQMQSLSYGSGAPAASSRRLPRVSIPIATSCISRKLG